MKHNTADRSPNHHLNSIVTAVSKISNEKKTPPRLTRTMESKRTPSNKLAISQTTIPSQSSLSPESMQSTAEKKLFSRSAATSPLRAEPTKLSAIQDKSNQYEELIELKVDPLLLKKSIFSPKSSTFTLFNSKLVQKTFEPLSRRTSSQSNDSIKLNRSVEEQKKIGSLDLGYSSGTNVSSRDSSRNNSISQSNKTLDQKIDKKYPTLAIKEQIDSEEFDTKRSINPFLDTDRLTEVDVSNQSRSSMVRNLISENSEFRSDYKFLQQTRKTEPMLSIKSDSLNSSAFADGDFRSKGAEDVRSKKRIKYTIRQFSKSKIQESVLAKQNGKRVNEDSKPPNEMILNENLKHRSSADFSSKNVSKGGIEQKHWNFKKVLKPSSNENKFIEIKPRSAEKRGPSVIPLKKATKTNFRETEKKKVPLKESKDLKGNSAIPNGGTAIKVSTPAENQNNNSSQSRYQDKPPSIDISADGSVIIEEGSNENYRQILTKSLNFIRDRRVEFSTLSSLRKLMKPHKSVLYSCTSLVMMLAGSCDSIPRETLHQKDLTWQKIKAYMHDTALIYSYLNSLPAFIDKNTPSGLNIDEALIYLDKSLDASKGTEAMPWAKSVKDLNGYLQAIINHSRLLRDDQNIKQLLLKYLESPKDPNMQVKLIDYEELPQASPHGNSRYKNKYFLESPTSLKLNPTHQTPKNKSTRLSCQGTPKETQIPVTNDNNEEKVNSRSLNASPQAALIIGNQLYLADSGYKFNLKKEDSQLSVSPEVIKAVSKISLDSSESQLVCSAFLTLFENCIRSIPLFLCRPAIMKKNWEAVRPSIQKYTLELSNLTARLRHLFDGQQISIDQVKESKRMLAKLTQQKSKQTIPNDNTSKTLETLEKYTHDAIDLYESLYGGLDLKSQSVSPSPSEERSIKKDASIFKADSNQNKSRATRSQSGIKAQAPLKKTLKAFTDSRRQSTIPVLPEKIHKTGKSIDTQPIDEMSTHKNTLDDSISYEVLKHKKTLLSKQIQAEKLKYLKKYTLFEQECRIKKQLAGNK